MKYSHYFLVFLTNVFFVFNVVSAGFEPLGVESPDLPDNGWYWAGASNGVSGWGLNIETQDASFSSTGEFMFGSIYTYDENGAPIWFTFSGEYTPNADVRAWRDENGVMGSLTSALRKTSGGGCLTCTQSEPINNDVVDTVTITWMNPIDARIVLSNGTSHEVSRMIWHNGIGAQDIDFITNGAWQVFWQDIVDDPSGGVVYHKGYKGLVHFVKLTNPSSEITNSAFYNANNVYYTSSLDDNILSYFDTQFGFDQGLNINSNLILEYDVNTRMVSLFELGLSINNGCSFLTSGYLRTSSSNTSLLYGVNDARCLNGGGSDNSLRNVIFASFTRIGNGSAAIANNPFLNPESNL